MKIKLGCGRGFMSVWCDGRDFDLSRPIVPAGHARGARRLSLGQVRRRLSRPIGAPPLRQLAAGSSHGRQAGDPVVVLFDDSTRPTPAGVLASLVVEELEAGGVAPEEIVFLAATGSHRPMTRSEMEAKLGRALTSRYRTVSHDFAGELVEVGRTSRGTPVLLNQLVARAGLIVGIGSVFPHGEVGFSGGGKILVPGVAGLATMAHNHIQLSENAANHAAAYTGAQRRDLDEAARLAKLRFIVNAILSPNLDMVEVFAGDPWEAHAAAAGYASNHFAPMCGGALLNEPDTGFDGVLAGSGPFDSDLYQAERALGVASRFCREGGAILWFAACGEGRGSHGVLERTAWGEARLRSLEALGERAAVFFCSAGLDPVAARDLLPSSFKVFHRSDEAAEAFAASLRGSAGNGLRRPRLAHLPWAAMLNW